MSDTGKPMEWTAQQWHTVQQAVYEEARKARVAARFLPLYGPISADAETVPAEVLKEGNPRGHVTPRLHVEDSAVLHLATIAVNVFLNSQQVAQPDLSAALTMFRRAANIIARMEDALIFRGSDAWKDDPNGIYRLTGGPVPDGLYQQGNKIEAALTNGQELVSAVARGISDLEDRGYVGPYALALSSELFITAETPNGGTLVLPSDRIRPLIEGPLVRTGTLEGRCGVLLSLAGKPVEIVVASEIAATFLQVSEEPRWIYRVSERFVLRVKEPESIVVLVERKPARK
jgi:uncharacterized linocin/CFP29 family protein